MIQDSSFFKKKQNLTPKKLDQNVGHLLCPRKVTTPPPQPPAAHGPGQETKSSELCGNSNLTKGQDFYLGERQRTEVLPQFWFTSGLEPPRMAASTTGHGVCGLGLHAQS